MNSLKVATFWLVDGKIVESIEPPSFQSSRVGGFDTEEKLRGNQNILEEPCCKCGKCISLTYSCKDDMRTRKLCFSCNFWYDRMAQVIVDQNYHAYYVPMEWGTDHFLGFGGRVLRFEGDDICYICNNVWHAGRVPEAWRNILKPNVKVVTNA
ncbi:MAG: hypothetical protein CL489_06285 [Acidobacteria bacterium]|nr:hypothetical protein [Acidobacteriota bacterium]